MDLETMLDRMLVQAIQANATKCWDCEGPDPQCRTCKGSGLFVPTMAHLCVSGIVHAYAMGMMRAMFEHHDVHGVGRVLAWCQHEESKALAQLQPSDLTEAADFFVKRCAESPLQLQPSQGSTVTGALTPEELVELGLAPPPTTALAIRDPNLEVKYYRRRRRGQSDGST